MMYLSLAAAVLTFLGSLIPILAPREAIEFGAAEQKDGNRYLLAFTVLAVIYGLLATYVNWDSIRQKPRWRHVLDRLGSRDDRWNVRPSHRLQPPRAPAAL